LAAVILVAIAGITQLSWTQYARKSNVSKGPRALGLVQLQSNGKARLIPVAIMVDGKFYDAGSYKATPVPMALDFGIVYEGFKTGVSQGLLTITQPGQLRHTWIAEGDWSPAGAKPASTRKKAEIPNLEEKDEPPKLHRPSDKPTPPSPSDKSETSKADQQKPAATPSAAPATKSETSTASLDLGQPIDDPNRPVLRRGKPDPNVRRERMKDFDESETASPQIAKDQQTKDNPLAHMIPAISDAGGPDAHSYAFDTKPAEEASFRAKMLDLASAELRRTNPAFAQSAISTGAKSAPPKSSSTRATRTPAAPVKLTLTDVQLRIFDLSSSNEPVLVLSARAPAPSPSRISTAQLPQEITLVAKTNLEGTLRKMFFSATDAQHLDVAPRMELIDAVDADGDGRGDLLFRRTTDAGSAYAIYRAAADQLWPLYEGTP
jgi:hypothetical protein